MCSSDCIQNNLKRTEKLIKRAVSQKANLIITPEVSSKFSLNKKRLLEVATTMKKDSYLLGIRRLARKYKKWILIGSLIIKNKKKLLNRSVLINDKGCVKTFYDKIHMYDAKLSKSEKYFESKTFQAGRNIKVVNLPWGKLGLSICYDLRFPNMYRKMSKKGAIYLSIPSAFTETTGKRHWHTLLKARAIENFSYVFAPGQAGKHCNGRKTYGHSMIVSPDGKILKEFTPEDKGEVYSIPTLFNHNNKWHALFGTGGEVVKGSLYLYDLEKKTPLWSLPEKKKGWISSPLVHLKEKFIVVDCFILEFDTNSKLLKISKVEDWKEPSKEEWGKMSKACVEWYEENIHSKNSWELTIKTILYT